jgi:hypothetical protein
MHTKQKEGGAERSSNKPNLKEGGAERSSNKPNLRKITPLELTKSRVPMQDQARSGSKAPPSSNLKLGKAPKQRREKHGDRGSRQNPPCLPPLFFLNSLPLKVGKVSSATQVVYYSARLTAASDSHHMAPGKRRRRNSSEGRIAKWTGEFEDSPSFSFLCDREKWRGIRVRRSESNRVRSRKFPSRRTSRCETERRHGRGGDDRGRMQGREGIAVEYLRRGWPGTVPTGGRARSRTPPPPPRPWKTRMTERPHPFAPRPGKPRGMLCLRRFFVRVTR